MFQTVWGCLKKLEIELPYDPAIPLLGIHTEETRSERDTCTPMFIAALFIIARCMTLRLMIVSCFFPQKYGTEARYCPSLDLSADNLSEDTSQEF